MDVISGPAVSPPPFSPTAETIIGRGQECTLPLVEESVSRRHASVCRRGQWWVLTDQGSRHGTYLNGVRLEPRQPAMLNDGDVISIGPWAFRACVGAARNTYTLTTD